MAPKHSPAPWVVRPDFTHRAKVVATIGGAEFVVCRVVTPQWQRAADDRQKEADANARLISASPELFSSGSQMSHAVGGLWAAIGDRLLANGPLSKEYAHKVNRDLMDAVATLDAALKKAAGL